MFDKEIFQKQLKEAGLFERACLRYYQKNGFEASMNPATDYKGLASHDLVVNGKLHECKMDYSALWTGKSCWELEALYHSKADFVNYAIPLAFIIPRSEAIKLAENGERKKVGDFNNEVGLVPLEELFNNPYLKKL